MSENLSMERKRPHFITTEFKAQRLLATNNTSENTFSISGILKALAITAVAATTFILVSDKNKRSRKVKEALAYEVW